MTQVKAKENSYQHYDKFVEPDNQIVLQNSVLKWYNIAKKDEPVPAEINDLARNFLEKESSQDLGELGFVILHRCGKDFYFLLVSTWRNGNELWESVYAKDGEKDKDFAPFTFETHHRGTYCIWELAAVWHERNAFRSFVLGEISKENYLQNLYRGEA